MKYTYLFEVVNNFRITNYPVDITYNSNTYDASTVLLNIDFAGQGQTPSYRVTFYTKQGSTQYNLFKERTGQKEAIITVLEETFVSDVLTWSKLWDFTGVLSEGSMVGNRYQTIVQHPIELILTTPPVKRWNDPSQKARTGNGDDRGLEMVSSITPNIFRNWAGSNPR